MQTLSEEEFKKKYGTAGVESFSQTPQKEKSPLFARPSLKEVGTELKNVATGAAKGLVQGGTSLVQGLNDLGTGVQAAVDPTRTYSDLKSRQEQAQSPFSGSAATQVNSQLEAKNTGEMVGKSLEFVAELLTPSGSRKAVEKGAEATHGAFKGISSKIAQIPDNLVEDGVRVKDKIIDLVTVMDDKTRDALNRTTPEEFKSLIDKGRQAMTSDKVKTPLESVGDQVIDGLKQVKDRAESIGKQKSAYVNQAKVGLKKVGSIGRDAALDVKRFAEGMKLDNSEKRFVQNFFNELKKISNNPTLKEVDQTIDMLQESIYKAGRSDVVEVTDRITGPLRQIIGKLNGRVGNIAGDSYKKYNKDYSELIGLVNELNSKVGKEGANAGSFVKRLFSPSDGRTKELFDQLEKYTGQDYFRDARLSKFVMETLGDTRATSLLEQIPTSPTDAIGKILNYGKKKLSDPLKAAERYIGKKK